MAAKRSAKILHEFGPRKAVALLSEPKLDGHEFLRPWALTSLICWATLDQRPGKREPRTDEAGKAINRKGFRSRRAKQAGQLFAAYWLDRALVEAERIGQPLTMNNLPSDVELAFRHFLQTGGFLSLAEFNGGKIVRLIRKRALLRELSYVYHMIDFMCRKHEFRPDIPQRIDLARAYVIKNEHDHLGMYKESKIEKIWNQYRSSSPYIYAFFRHISLNARLNIPIREVAAGLLSMAQGQRIQRLLGYAAHAADRVAETPTRGVRVRDFLEVPRVRPQLRPFTWENAWLEGFDRKSPIA
ncbi:MAG TPA: hypothetical protein VGU24_21270 [Microvirga sp.]|jgi:hypothetical protein|nr:hypothetical protein [Microvirga sp.]